MTGRYRTRPTQSEQLIAALVPVQRPRRAPVPRPRRAPVPAPQAVLPARRPTVAPPLLVDVARLDRSGRLSARGLLRALAWPPGHRQGIAWALTWWLA